MGPPPDMPVQSPDSGIAISSDGLVATNNHMIVSATQIEVVLEDERRCDAELKGGRFCGQREEAVSEQDAIIAQKEERINWLKPLMRANEIAAWHATLKTGRPQATVGSRLVAY